MPDLDEVTVAREADSDSEDSDASTILIEDTSPEKTDLGISNSDRYSEFSVDFLTGRDRREIDRFFSLSRSDDILVRRSLFVEPEIIDISSDGDSDEDANSDEENVYNKDENGTFECIVISDSEDEQPPPPKRSRCEYGDDCA
jgi:hypothetical protein